MSSSAQNKNQQQQQQQDLNALAEEAEHDLNSWYAKTGHRRTAIENDEAPGINELEATRKFPGTEIRYGEDYVTNKSWDKKIPEPEGGDRDDKGHLLHGHCYEGAGGPEDKTAHVYQHSPGRIDEEVVKGWGLDPVKLTEETFDHSRPDLLPPEMARGHGYDNDTDTGPHKYQQSILESGRKAAQTNVYGAESEYDLGHHRDLPTKGAGVGNKHHKWTHHETWVPDQAADMNEIPPKSVVETSRNLR